MVRYITTKELMESLQISRRTVNSLMARGLPHIKIGHNVLRFIMEDVQAWVDEQNNEQKKRA